jgi:hypothetical protein
MNFIKEIIGYNNNNNMGEAVPYFRQSEKAGFSLWMPRLVPSYEVYGVEAALEHVLRVFAGFPCCELMDEIFWMYSNVNTDLPSLTLMATA